MVERVWIDEGLIADRGPIYLGDNVSWNLFPARPADLRWLSRVIGSIEALRVDYHPRGDGKSLATPMQGTVSAISLIWDRAPGGAAHDTNLPSGGLRSVSAANLADEPAGRRTIGYLIDVSVTS